MGYYRDEMVRITTKDSNPKLYLTVRANGVPTFTTIVRDHYYQFFELIPTGVPDQYIITIKYGAGGGKLSLGWNEKNPNNGGFFAKLATGHDDMKWYIKKYAPPTTTTK